MPAQQLQDGPCRRPTPPGQATGPLRRPEASWGSWCGGKGISWRTP